MDITQLLSQIFELCVIPLLGVLTSYLVNWLKNKNAQVKAQTDNELYKKYMDLLNQTISDCVIAINQTYVDTLKAQGNFTPDAQKKAFDNVVTNVKTIVGNDAITYLNESMGDLNTYITSKVESTVKSNKKEGT